MPEEVAENLPQKKRRVPQFLKNRYFIFTVSSVLFILSLITLILVDSTNTFRPKWADFVYNWLKSLGLTWDVSMTTWFIFFIFFGLFFFFFFVTLFYKHGLQRKERKIAEKHDREMTKEERARYKIVFWVLTVTVLVAIFTGGIVFLIVTHNFEIIARQLQDLPTQLLNFITTLGILIGLMLVVPLAFFLLILVFRFLIMIISLIAGNVQDTVMASESYQKNLAAAQAVSDELNARKGGGRRGGRGGEGNGGNGGNSNIESPQQDIIFPALTSIDVKWEEKAKKEAEAAAAEAKKAELIAAGKYVPEPEEVKEKTSKKEEKKEVEIIIGAGAARTTRSDVVGEPRGPLDYEQFKLLAYEFQSYLCHNKYYFKINTLRCFIAGMAAARLLLLQGLSGTGKSTLPRVFLEYIGGDAYFFPVQATWRDRSDITGYYSDFTGQFKETELLKHLYEASYIPETCNLMVLDEMNISRVEYYFADFLSIFEYPAEDWVVPLIQVKPGTKLPKYIENGMVRIPVNTWFVGTVNIDDSTFTITDKVYDRAIAIDFNELNLPFESSYRFDGHPIKITELITVFNECKAKPENNLTPAERKKFLDLVKFISETFDIQFGNRIMNQIDNFLPVFVGLGGTKNEALDFMVARKVLRKLEGKFESYIKDGLNKLNRYLNSSYGKHVFAESEAMIEKYRRKLS